MPWDRQYQWYWHDTVCVVGTPMHDAMVVSRYCETPCSRGSEPKPTISTRDSATVFTMPQGSVGRLDWDRAIVLVSTYLGMNAS